MSPYIILGPHKYFSHIIQVFSMILGSHQFFLCKTHINISHIYYPNILHAIRPSQMLLTQAHKLPWDLSQILPIIAHILSNLGFHKNTHHITTKIGPQDYIILTQSLTSFDLRAKPKESPKFQKSHYDVANSKSHYDVANSKSPTTMWLIQQSHYDVANSKSHYDVANSKSPITMWLIQPSHYDVADLKSHYDVADSKSLYDVADSKSHYDVANSKSPTTMWLIQRPTTMWQIQSLLRCGTIYKDRYNPASLKARYDSAPLKARCYTAPFTKPVATQQYFTKSQNYFP